MKKDKSRHFILKILNKIKFAFIVLIRMSYKMDMELIDLDLFTISQLSLNIFKSAL